MEGIVDRITTKVLNDQALPLVIEPTNSNLSFSEFLDILGTNNPFFKKSLLKHGGLLFRNFPVQDQRDFAAVIKHLQTGDFVDYIGGDSPRTKVIDGIYTSTETPPSMTLPLHNELSYVKHFPKYIYFYCDIPPLVRGETIVADARTIYRTIDPEVKRRFTEKSLRYVSCYPYKSAFLNFINKHHKSWVNVFESEDKREVEKKCLQHEISFEWHANDWLKISQVLPSTIIHPQTLEKVWFNQAHHFDLNPRFLGWWRYLGVKLLYCRKNMMLHEVYFHDNTPISREDLYHILDVLEQQSIYFPWQKGDVLLLDNILAMHGRASFSGKRRILTAMTN